MTVGAWINLRPGHANVAVLAGWKCVRPLLGTIPTPPGCVAPSCEEPASDVVVVTFDTDDQLHQDNNGQIVDNVIVPATDTDETAFFTLTWYAGTAVQLAEIDVAKGQQCLVTASSLSVTGSYPLLPAPATQPEIIVRATVGTVGGKGSPGVTSSCRRTIRLGTVLDLATSVIFPIPRMAVSAVMRNTVLAVPTLTFEQLAGATAANPINVSPIGKLEVDAVPVAAGARFFRIGNPGAIDATRVSVVFHLAIS